VKHGFGKLSETFTVTNFDGIKTELLNLKENPVINEMNTNSFYPAKYIDGSQVVGIDCRGEEQIWMIRTDFREKYKRLFNW
jgi:hypothetical protein